MIFLKSRSFSPDFQENRNTHSGEKNNFISQNFLKLFFVFVFYFAFSFPEKVFENQDVFFSGMSG